MASRLLVLAFALPCAAYHLLAPAGQQHGSRRCVSPRGFSAMQMADAPVKIDADETYKIMMRTLLETENVISDEVSVNYKLFDYAFLQRLDQQIEANDPDKTPRLLEIKDAVNAEMGKRIGQAAEALKDVLSSPTPVVMEGKMAGLVRQGKVDDALMQLLEANLQQAQAAGEAGKGAVAALSKLQQRVQQELDEKIPPAQSLLRQLLRMDSKPARVTLLSQKMAAKEKSVVLQLGQDMEEEDQNLDPDVEPRALAEAIKELKLRFGNVDEQYDTGFMKKVEEIASEAEQAALDLAGGQEVSAKEAQDMMWNDRTVSVWDLGNIEDEAHQDGKFAVWEAEGQQIVQDQEQRKRSAGLE